MRLLKNTPAFLNRIENVKTVRQVVIVVASALVCGLLALLLSGILSVILTFHSGLPPGACTFTSGTQSSTVTGPEGHVFSDARAGLYFCDYRNSWWWIVPASGGVGLLVGGAGAVYLIRRRQRPAGMSGATPTAGAY